MALARAPALSAVDPECQALASPSTEGPDPRQLPSPGAGQRGPSLIGQLPSCTLGPGTALQSLLDAHPNDSLGPSLQLEGEHRVSRLGR